MSEEILTTAQVAVVLGVNANYVGELRNRGLLKMMKLGSWKCRRSTLDEFIRWAENKDFSDLNNIRDLETGEIVKPQATAAQSA